MLKLSYFDCVFGNLRWCLGMVAGLFALALCTVVANAQQNGGMGPLSQILPQTGQDGPWRITNTGGTFEIQNSTDPGPIKYFYAALNEGEEGRRTIEASLVIHPDSQGSAGILYGFDQQNRSYHLLTLGPDGTVTLFRRDDQGFSPFMETKSSDFLKDKINKLRIEEKGDTILYFLNGAKLGEVGGNKFGRGSVGIAAVGAVRAFFDGFSVDIAEQSGRNDAPSTNTNANVNTNTNTSTAEVSSDAGLQLKQIQIMDEAGPAGRMTAYSTLIPVDWEDRGGVRWSGGDGAGGCFTGGQLIWGAGLKDQSYGLAFLDPLSWGATSFGPARNVCLQQDLPDAEAAARAFLQAISQGLRTEVKQVLRPPELAPLVETFSKAYISNLPGVRTWVDGVVVTVSAQSQGVKNDGAFVFITHHIEGKAAVGNTASQFRTGRTVIALGLFTPPGKLEAGHPAFGVILNNLRANPQWQQVVAKWWADRSRANRPAPGVAAAGGGKTSIGDMMHESWKRRQGMTDSGQQQSVNGIWEVEPYKSSSGTVLLSQDYKNAWELQDGRIIMTNDQFFNPVQNFNQTGQALQRAN
ncbi:MAG: hypothetical protein ABJN26_09835 [Stappiaceae bacterium]